MPKPDTTTLRFGLFELDGVAGELRKDGRRVRLAPQPWRILSYLVLHAGRLVSRDELAQQTWGGVSVDYDAGLNAAIRKIRRALAETSDAPRFIETVPRRGYRFIAPVSKASPQLDGRRSVPRTGRFTVAASIALGVIGLIVSVPLTRAIQGTAVPDGGINSHAIQAYENGIETLEFRRGRGPERAAGFFREAIALEPRFVEARVGLARSIVTQGAFGVMDPERACFSALAEVAPLIASGQAPAAAWAIRGRCKWLVDWDLCGARKDYETAVAKDPGDVTTRQRLASVLTGLGEHDAAMRQLDQARRSGLEPWASARQSGWQHFHARRYEDAIRECSAAIRLVPADLSSRHCLYESHVMLGRHDEAYRYAQAMLGAAGAEPEELRDVLRAPANEGWTKLVGWWTDERRPGFDDLPLMERAVIHLRQGRPSLSIDLLERCAARREAGAAYLAVDPRLDPLRDDPRFVTLLSQIGLTRGCAPDSISSQQQR